MNNTIQSSYYAGLYGINANLSINSGKKSHTTVTGTNFYDMAVQTTARSTDSIRTENVDEIEAPSLENMLKARYPGLAYHVFDASTSYWRTRNDYPHYMLYDQNCDVSVLENWRPVGENPFYGSIDGKFIAPKEIHALGSVPPGSKAVVIHPDVQKRMEEDPDYAYEIMETIDNWFAYDIARNEAVMPGHTVGMSQAVAIGKDGTIVNAAASKSGGTLTKSSDEMVQAYYRRLKKRAEFYHWLEQDYMRELIFKAE